MSTTFTKDVLESKIWLALCQNPKNELPAYIHGLYSLSVFHFFPLTFLAWSCQIISCWELGFYTKSLKKLNKYSNINMFVKHEFTLSISQLHHGLISILNRTFDYEEALCFFWLVSLLLISFKSYGIIEWCNKEYSKWWQNK